MAGSTLLRSKPRRPLISQLRRNAAARAELPAPFRAASANHADIDRALERFDATGAVADRDALLNHLLPLVTDLATFELARPNRADDELDVLVSDGCAVLVPALVKLAQLPAANALAFAARIIRQGFWKGRRERAWSGGNSREREKVIRRFRTAFVRERGEAPTAEQVREHLATLFTNPQMPVVTRRRMVPFSELESDPDRASLIDQVPDPHRTIDTRAIKAAMRLFKGDDRKMFRMAIDGANLRDIAATVGISKGAAFSSVNGLLWRARCDRRLASELGVVADTTPLRDPKHGWISVRNRPPAALAG